MDIPLSMKQHFHILYRILYNSAAPKWKDIGIFLGLDEAKLDVIEVDESRVQSRLEKMLSLWLKQNDSPPTKFKIIEVLKDLDLNAEAEKLEKELTQ